jgi:hypothetical protein
VLSPTELVICNAAEESFECGSHFGWRIISAGCNFSANSRDQFEPDGRSLRYFRFHSLSPLSPAIRSPALRADELDCRSATRPTTGASVHAVHSPGLGLGLRERRQTKSQIPSQTGLPGNQPILVCDGDEVGSNSTGQMHDEASAWRFFATTSYFGCSPERRGELQPERETTEHSLTPQVSNEISSQDRGSLKEIRTGFGKMCGPNSLTRLSHGQRQVEGRGTAKATQRLCPNHQPDGWKRPRGL